MSHYMTALAMRQTGIKPATKIVLYWLADHHNGETGLCFPSLKTLERECEMNRSAVVRHLDALEDAGLIARNQRTRDNGSQTSTAYTLHLVPVAERNTPCCETQQPPVAKRDPLNLGILNLGIEPKDTDVSLPKTRQSRKSRMKEDAVISDGMHDAAHKRGHSQQEADAQFAKFKNNALAKGLSYVSWDRAFVTWLDSEYFRPITTKGTHNGKRNSNDGSGAAMAQRAGERFAARLMDQRAGANASQPLLPTGQPGRGNGSCD